MDSTNQDTTFRVDMNFTKGTSNAKVYPFAERKEYHNYYLGHMNIASARTSLLNTIVKSGVYTNIDVIYTHSASGFRHWQTTPTTFHSQLLTHHKPLCKAKTMATHNCAF